MRQQFSVTNQTAAIDQDLSARENLRLFGRLNGLSAKASRTRANELLTDFDLDQSADQTLATFSGGMRRRLDLAVSLVGKPRILFLDEPTTDLDPRAQTQMWHAIQKLVAVVNLIVPCLGKLVPFFSLCFGWCVCFNGAIATSHKKHCDR